jgi:hypothetical protein
LTEYDMSTVARRISSDVLVGDGSQTGSSNERGFRIRGPVDDEWGRSECLDPDNVGDIADEGMGHRG